MRAFFIDIQRPLDSRLLDPVTRNDIGSAVKSINRRFYKPAREFSLRVWDQMLRTQLELIRNEIHGVRATAVMLFDGDQYGEITEPIFIAQGNGVQTEFPMPMDNVHAPSWKIFVNETLNTNWTMREESGVLVFGSAPDGRITGIGKRKFRVIQIDQSDSILTESQLYTNENGEGVYSVQPIVLLEVEATSVS